VSSSICCGDRGTFLYIIIDW